MDSGRFINPGSAYYFKGWSPEPKPNNQAEQNKLPGKDSWKDWTTFSQFEQERPQSVGSGASAEDLSLACNVGEAREMQRKKAQKIAFACAPGKKNKAALMFQKRFERAEKYALVREPMPRAPTPPNDCPVPPRKDEVASKEDKNEEARKEEAEEELNNLPLHPPLAPELSFLNRKVPENMFVACPKPWTHQVESPPSPPPYKDFNRTPRGFAGSYFSPYANYVLESPFETGDL